LYADRLHYQEVADGLWKQEQIEVSGTYAGQKIHFRVTPVMDGAHPQRYELRGDHGPDSEGTAYSLLKELKRLYPDTQALSDLTIQKIDVTPGNQPRRLGHLTDRSRRLGVFLRMNL
jgi:hypothetical protein